MKQLLCRERGRCLSWTPTDTVCTLALPQKAHACSLQHCSQEARFGTIHGRIQKMRPVYRMKCYYAVIKWTDPVICSSMDH
jgi:hypothetical protein